MAVGAIAGLEHQVDAWIVHRVGVRPAAADLQQDRVLSPSITPLACAIRPHLG